MFYYNRVIYLVFSLIIFFVIFIITASFCYAQYSGSLFEGYLGYPSWTYPDQYSLLGIYSNLSEIKDSYSLIGGHDNIYKGLSSDFGMMSNMINKVNMTNSLTMFRGLALLPGNLAAFGMNEINMTNPLFMMGGLVPLSIKSDRFEIIGGLNAFGQLNSGTAGNLAGYIVLDEPGSLAGLVSLGSNAGLISTGVMGLITPFGF